MSDLGIIKDSSIWTNPSSYNAVDKRDNQLRIGIIKEVFFNKETGDFRYLVETRDKNDAIEVNCRMLRKFGGVYNYEDIIHRGYNIDDNPDPVSAFEAKAGDIVLVGMFNGQGREGVIIGGLMHAARKSTLDVKKGPQYKSEFNGIETSINELGEYTLTFKGQPTNLSKLKDKPSVELPAAQYNTDIGSSYFKMDSKGSLKLDDNSKQDPQSFKIDKELGVVDLISGKISLRFKKEDESVSLKSKILSINSEDSITIETKIKHTSAIESATIDSPKIALGTGNIELLDMISQLCEEVKKLATENSSEIHPTGVGPSGPPTNAGQYSAIASKAGEIKSKIDTIKGTL